MAQSRKPLSQPQSNPPEELDVEVELSAEEVLQQLLALQLSPAEVARLRMSLLTHYRQWQVSVAQQQQRVLQTKLH